MHIYSRKETGLEGNGKNASNATGMSFLSVSDKLMPGPPHVTSQLVAPFWPWPVGAQRQGELLLQPHHEPAFRRRPFERT